MRETDARSNRRSPLELWSPRLTALLIASILLLGAISFLSSRSLSTLKSVNTWVLHTEQVQTEIGRVLQLLTDVETGMRGYALAGDKKFLDPYYAALPQLPKDLASLKHLISDNPAQRSNVAQLDSLAQARLAHAQRVVQRIESGDVAGGRALVASGEGQRRMDAVRRVTAQMQAEETRLLSLRRVSSDQALHDTQLALGVTGALAVLLLLFIAYSAVAYGARIRRGEKTLATTLHSIGDAVISTDAAGAVQFMNAVAEALTGWDQKSAFGRPLDEVFRIVNEQTRAAVDNPATKVLSGGAIVGLANHTVLIARDGTERPIDDSAAPIRDSAGRMLGAVLVFRDVSAQRRTEREIRRSEARKSAILETALDCIITIDHEGNVVA